MHYCCLFRIQWHFKKSVQWLISALPKSPYNANVIFGSGHMLPPVSPKLSPPSPWKPGFAESIQAPSHLHVYQRAFTAQWPQQVLSNGPIVLQNHPKSELPASCSLAVSSAVETPVSFLGLLKPSLPTYGNCAPATC